MNYKKLCVAAAMSFFSMCSATEEVAVRGEKVLLEDMALRPAAAQKALDRISTEIEKKALFTLSSDIKGAFLALVRGTAKLNSADKNILKFVRN